MTPLGWAAIVRLGLVQAALGAVVVLVTSTINRVMVVELGLPALLPGALVALHYAVQVLRPRLGYGSDAGGRRTPWIVAGIAVLALGAAGAATSVAVMATHPAWGLLLAVPAYVLVGGGVGAAGTSLLALTAHRVAPGRRAAAATVLWLEMIFGIAATAGIASRLLDPFTPARLLAVTAGVGTVAVLTALAGVWGIEGEPAPAQPMARPAAAGGFLPALREVWAEPQARRFTIFVFLSMLAYSALELVLEPFAGAVFAFTPGESAGLTGLQHGGVLAGMALVAVGATLAGDYRERAMRAWTVGGCLASAAAVAALAGCSLAGPGAPLRAAAFVLGTANGAFSVAAIGAMMGLAGGSKAGREGTRLGVWGAAQALAFGAGGLLGTGTADAARAVLGTASAGYAAVFAAEALLFLGAAALALRVFGSARALPAPRGALQPG